MASLTGTMAAVPISERLAELFRYRELVANLTVRDLKLKYRRSVLGAAWSLLNPLIMMAIYTAVFNVILKIQFGPGYHYWAFVLIGLVAWLFFAGSVAAAVPALVRNSGLVTKVYFPTEALPISTVLANVVNFLISLAALIVIVAVGANHLGVSLVLLPVIVLAEIGFVLGLALMISCLTVYFRDLEHLVGIGLTALIYVSPVFYPLNLGLVHKNPAYDLYLAINPLSWYLDSYHRVLFWGSWPDPLHFGLMLISAALSLVLGYLLFMRLRPRLPEEV